VTVLGVIALLASTMTVTLALAIAAPSTANADPPATPYVFDKDWRISGGWTPNINFSQAVAVGPNETVYVLESSGGAVTIYDRNGKGYFLFGKGPYPIEHIQQAYDLEVESNGNILVADSNGIERFQKNGTWINSFGPAAPAGAIALAPDGSVYVYVTAGAAGARIEHWSADGTLLGSIGSPGTNDGQVTATKDLDVLPSGDVVLVDGARVQIISAAGVFIRSWNYPVSTTGLTGLDIDPLGRIHVALGNTRRVAVFDTLGTLLTTYGVGDPEIPTAPETRLVDVAVGFSNTSFAIVEDPAAPSGNAQTRVLRFHVAGVPSVSAIAPNQGTLFGGGLVHLTGSSFSGATSVRFGSTAATSFTLIDDRHIDAVAPARATEALIAITVVTPRGTSPSAPSNWFKYQTVPKPTITSLSWNKSKVPGGGTISINGTNFTGATQVRFGPFVATTFSVSSDNTITVVVPPATGPQLVNVFVQTPAGTSDASAPGSGSTTTWFTYKVGPTVNGVSPNHGPVAGGTTITITGGTYFKYGGTVRVGGVIVPYSWIDYGTIAVTAPSAAGPGPVDVVVSDDYGDSVPSAASTYTYE
jgi:hypothetical protein